MGKRREKGKKKINVFCQVVSDRSASVPIRGEWVTFLIKKSVIGRNGWKIMTENEAMNLRLNRETIEMVTEKIRYGMMADTWKFVYDFLYPRKKHFVLGVLLSDILIKMSLPLKSENPYRS